jgi:beta-lactamase regulating signal transducer with metallopeptidase domain/peroxiredoxin
MSQFSNSWLEFSAGLLDLSSGFVLTVKWTAVLGLAWLAHAMLARQNPRWRVAVWRSTVVGLVLVAVLSSFPPFVRYRVSARGRAPVEVVRSALATTSIESQSAAAVVSEREPGATTRPKPAAVRSAPPVSGIDPDAGLRWADPVTADAPGPPPSAGIGAWALTTWLAGVLVLVIRLIVGSLCLGRLVRRSSEVSREVVGECRAIAARLRCRRAVRVRRTSEVATPCLTGLWHPVLLLPERECAEARSEELRAILSHELAHARNQDLAWNLAAQLASIVLWFHPLAWRIRATHAAACDSVCDAVAADLVGDVACYGRTLARLAIQAARPARAHGLAMARTSDIRRRLDELNRMVFRTALSWRSVSLALFVVTVLLLFIGGFGFTPAEQAVSAPKSGEAAEPAGQKPAGRLTLRAVAAETGLPIDGVSISYRRIRTDGTNQKGSVTTGNDGLATVENQPDFDAAYFEITARMPHFVPVCLRWDDKRHPLVLPDAKELRFERGTTIGGIVKDEAGRPIEGATVSVYAPPTECEAADNGFTLGEPKTDGRGRWRLDVAPRNLAGVGMNVEHPHYRMTGGMVSRNLESVSILTKGLTVTGRVVDAAGRPVKDAQAFMGYDKFVAHAPTATTNERGEFSLENCTTGPTIITIEAEGFAPQFRDVRVEARTAPVEFQLTEPGSSLRGKVVDIEGKPVAGAYVAAARWRGHQSLRLRVLTDREGRFAWRSAPRDVVVYGVGKFGYMSSPNVPLSASDREQVITLYPELVISGRVTDASSSRRVPKFRLIRGFKGEGQEEIHWAENEAVEITGGAYRARFNQECAGSFVRVEAAEHQPAVSRAFRSTEGSQRFDFALARGEEQLSGVVLFADGKPAAGAEVAIDTRDMGFLMEGGRFDRRADVPIVPTGPDGRFTFKPPGDQFLLIAASDGGYADASPEEFAKSGKLVLQPWGKIEGGVWIGRRPASNQQIDYNPGPFVRGGRTYAFSYGYSTFSDQQGRFAFDRVVPGRGTASRVVTNVGDRSVFQPWGWQEAVEVKPTQTAHVRIGGKGRPVIGRVVADGEPEAPIDWMKCKPIVIQLPLEEVKDSSSWQLFGSNFEKDGRFRIEDVPPGKYVLEVTVNAAPDPRVWGAGAEIGTSRMKVNVPAAPPGWPDAPLDLGTITAGLFETLKAGDRASDFAVPRIVGKVRRDQIRLSDYQGKLVILDFWASWCGPCVADMPAIKDLQKTFGSDSRFQLIGLSCDETAEAAERYIKENGLVWAHGFAGNLLAVVNAGKVYKVRAIPATFLIGPDGRILARNLRGAELKDAVRKALENPKLFPVATRATQPPGSP